MTPWVGTAQAVGQRVTPLKRMKAATAASSSFGIIFRILPPMETDARPEYSVRPFREPPSDLASWRSCDLRSARAGERVLARRCSPLQLAADPAWSAGMRAVGGGGVA